MDTESLLNSPARQRRVVLRPRTLALLLVGMGGAVALILAGYTPAAHWLTRSKGEHLTLAEARGRVHLELPAGASDICFYQHWHPDRVVVVDFAITEAAFLEWAAAQGWKPEQLGGSVTIWPRAAFGDWATVVEVTDGYAYSTLERGVPNTFSVTYDRESGRAYYGFSSEPHTGED